jgi:hypothetical protein
MSVGETVDVARASRADERDGRIAGRSHRELHGNLFSAPYGRATGFGARYQFAPG